MSKKKDITSTQKNPAPSPGAVGAIGAAVPSTGTAEPDAAGAVDAEGANTQANEPDAGLGSQEPSAATAPAEKAGDTKQTAEPKVSDAVVKIGKTLLKSNPAMSVVFMTTDGRGFYEKNDADNHARTLKNKVVTPVKK